MLAQVLDAGRSRLALALQLSGPLASTRRLVFALAAFPVQPVDAGVAVVEENERGALELGEFPRDVRSLCSALMFGERLALVVAADDLAALGDSVQRGRSTHTCVPPRAATTACAVRTTGRAQPLHARARTRRASSQGHR
jgi:hypothetical protein